jgi:hypothetical protein
MVLRAHGGERYRIANRPETRVDAAEQHVDLPGGNAEQFDGIVFRRLQSRPARSARATDRRTARSESLRSDGTAESGSRMNDKS